MKSRFHGILVIHLAVLLFGAAGLFGKFLELPPIAIVFGRTLFAAIALLVVVLVLGTGIRCKQTKDLLGFLLLGGILAAHWVTFFYSIQISTVAIGLLTFASFPLFVTFLEPFFFRERIRTFDIAISLIVFMGLLLIVPEFDLSNHLTQGVIWGTVSGLTFATLSVLNRRFVANYPALTVALYQNAVACLVVLPFAAGSAFSLTPLEFGQLIILGVVFTAFAHTLFIRGMLAVKARLAGVVACLEPVYGIFFALVLLKEVPSTRELLGGVVIIGVVAYATTRSGEYDVSQA